MRTAFVGEAPSRTSDPDRPLEGRPMRWLAKVAHLEESELRERVRCFNLLSYHPGRTFPVSRGRLALIELGPKLAEVGVERLVLLGHAVASSFDAGWMSPLVFEKLWVEWAKVDAVLVPHPSGLNRWWNDVENRQLAGVLLRSIVEEATPWPI